MSSYFDMGYFGAPRAAPVPLVTRFGWADDLTALPDLEFDASLSSGITEAQLLAGLSVSSGALRAQLADMISAGASVGAIAVAWLTARVLKAPTQLYTDGQLVTANTGSATNNGLLGLALYHFADGEEATSPSNPPGGSQPLASMEWGLAGSGARQFSRQSWGAAAAGAANVDLVGGTVDACALTNGRTGIVRQGNAYPPASSSSAVTDSRAITSGTMVEAHRLRLALIVRLTGSGTLPTMTIRRCQLDYRPVA